MLKGRANPPGEPWICLVGASCRAGRRLGEDASPYLGLLRETFSDGVDGEGDFLDVGLGHGFIDRHVDALFEEGFGDRTTHFGVVHRGEAEIPSWPGAGVEVVSLKQRVAVNGLGRATFVGVDAFSFQGRDKLVFRDSEFLGFNPKHIVVETMGVFRMNFRNGDPRGSGESLIEQGAGAHATSDDVVVLAQLGGADRREGFAHTIVVRELVGIADVGDAVVALVAPFREVRSDVVVVRAHHATVSTGEVLEVVE